MKGCRLLHVAVATALLLCCSVIVYGGPRKKADDPVMRSLKYYPKEQQATYLYTEGLKNSLMFGDRERSAQLFQAAIALDSLHAPSFFELANLNIQNPETALPYCKKAVSLDSTNTWYLGLLGRLYLMSNSYDSALRVSQKLIKMAPNNADNYLRLAALYEQQKQPFSAIAILDTAETRFGLMEEVARYKRQLLFQVKLYDKALNEAKELTVNFPYEPMNFVVLAETYAAMGRDSLALEAYEQARMLSPKNTGVLISLNEFYKRRGDDINYLATARLLFEADDIPLDNKIEFYKEITAFDDLYRTYYFQINNLISDLAIRYPNDFRITQLYATHMIRSGNLDGALQLYKSHKTDSTHKREVFTEILSMESYLQRPDSVEKYANLALEIFPSDPDLYLMKGFGKFYFMKDYAGAEKEFLTALKLAQTDSLRSVIYCTLGDNCQRMGNSKQTYAYYRKGLKYDPDNSMLLNNYSYYLSEQNEKLQLADRMSQRACELSPKIPTYLDTRAWVLYRLGRYAEAKTLMQQAIALDSNGDGKELYLHYGDILYALNDTFMAIFYWEKAKELGYDPEQIDQRIKQAKSK